MKVLVFGTFDLLHPGHRFVLDAAGKRGELYVVVARDRTVERIKGRLPVHDEVERVSRVRAAAPAATVMLGSGNDFLEPVRAVRPDLIVLGYDQTLPPGVTESDLPCPTERLESFEPQKYKTSILRSM